MTDPASALTQADRDHLQTFVGDDRGTAPWWYHLGVGAASGLAIASGDIRPRWLAVVTAIAGAAAIGALLGWWTRRAGAVPRLRAMPAPLRNVLMGYWVVFGVVMGIVLTWAFLTQGDWAFTRAGVVQLIVVGLGGIATDAIYRRRARALADEAGISRG